MSFENVQDLTLKRVCISDWVLNYTAPACWYLVINAILYETLSQNLGFEVQLNETFSSTLGIECDYNDTFSLMSRHVLSVTYVYLELKILGLITLHVLFKQNLHQ